MSGVQLQKRTIALAGNPNVGKSTLFNALTGLRQHTGNWPGKTVGVARGQLSRRNVLYEFVDLPGTYSLSGESEDEKIAAEYIASGQADCTVVVCDGSSLERSLIFALQILERTQPVILCINLMDEAERKGIILDKNCLREQLGIPVVMTEAGKRDGLEQLLDEMETARSRNGCLPHFEDPIQVAHQIACDCTVAQRESKPGKMDRLLVSRWFGIPILLVVLLFIVWLTVWGANYPSELLARGLDTGYVFLKRLCVWMPGWMSGILLDGMYATSARVISVMLPPMAIFFPLFTILEDIGYLPRMAFLLDGGMQKCGGCGKQALTLCMGLGCNAVGVMGCRIIDSPQERRAAILTNAMVPCNGRFPTLILLGSLFFTGSSSALIVASCIALGMCGAMAVTGAFNRSISRERSGTFLMEMPPFRRPRIGQILVRSLLDRTLHIAARALKVAAPAGATLWLLTNTQALRSAAAFLDPLGRLLGLQGAILVAFFFAFPANELFIPVALMILSGAGNLSGASVSGELLIAAGWTWKTAVCAMVFCLFHWPCATTLMTIYRETGSKKETAAAFFLPTAVGVVLCMLLNLLL